MTATEVRHIEQLSDDIYTAVFQILDADPCFDGDDAGMIADRCQKTARVMIKGVFAGLDIKPCDDSAHDRMMAIVNQWAEQQRSRT